MTQTYTKNTLYEIAEKNYLALIRFCNILEQEGYWEQPKAVLKMSIYECLDWYIQAVLIQFAVTCNLAGTEQRKFLYTISRFHPFYVNEKDEISTTVSDETKKATQSPPVIIQLCGLRDNEKDSGLTGLFFEAVVNIIMALAYLESAATNLIVKYVTEMYNRIGAFLFSVANNMQLIDEKYIFYKVNNVNLEKSSKGIYAAGENFWIYKEDTIGMPRIKQDTVEGTKEFIDKEEELRFRQYMKNKLRQRKSDKKKTDTGTAYEEDDGFKKYIGNYEEFEDNIEENEKLLKKDKELDIHESGDETDSNVKKEDNKKDAADEINAMIKKTRLDELLDELNGLIGLSEVKKEIKSLINLIKVKKIREKHNLPVMDMSYHMIFTGNPGTGKTTVARLVAELYKELGLLSKGNLVETDRAGLIAGFVGQTAIKVTEVVERATGGVLFIDEAYSLSNSIGANDFGGEAIDTLVKLMEDHRDDLVIIAAGYTKEMEGFLKSNTGLVSRFNKFIEFPDYSDEELIQILSRMSSKSGFNIEEEAVLAIQNHLSSRSDGELKAFGNARGIRNMFEKMVVNQANRIVECQDLTIEQLTLINKEDVLQ